MQTWVQYWKQQRGFIYCSAFLLFTGFAVGIVFHEPLQTFTELFLDQMDQKIGFETRGLTLFTSLFSSNLIAAALIMVLGLGFGFFPLYSLMLNGFLIGSLLQMGSQSGANPFNLFLLGILPHGIFEITAILLAGAYGLKLGTLVFQSTRRLLIPKMRGSHAVEWRKSLRQIPMTLGTITLLFLLAAAVEGTITVQLVENFIS